jgi:AAA domain
MRLERVRLIAYRQFIDEELRLDRRLTVIVGRNDTGKTGLLSRFFDQHFFEGVIHSADKPQLGGYSRNKIIFGLDWRVETSDYECVQYRNAFGDARRQRVSLGFESSDVPAKLRRYVVDDKEIDVYAGTTAEGQPILREEFLPRNLFPRPTYISRQPVQTMFQVRLANVEPYPRDREHRLPSTPERLLMEFVGLPAATRPISDEKWPPREFGSEAPRLQLSDVEAQLAVAGEHLTRLVRQWWFDPPNITVRIRLTGSQEFKQAAAVDHQYTVVFEAHDALGLPLQGTGFRWFLAFLMEIELLRRNPLYAF